MILNIKTLFLRNPCTLAMHKCHNSCWIWSDFDDDDDDDDDDGELFLWYGWPMNGV